MGEQPQQQPQQQQPQQQPQQQQQQQLQLQQQQQQQQPQLQHQQQQRETQTPHLQLEEVSTERKEFREKEITGKNPSVSCRVSVAGPRKLSALVSLNAPRGNGKGQSSFGASKGRAVWKLDFTADFTGSIDVCAVLGASERRLEVRRQFRVRAGKQAFVLAEEVDLSQLLDGRRRLPLLFRAIAEPSVADMNNL